MQIKLTELLTLYFSLPIRTRGAQFTRNLNFDFEQVEENYYTSDIRDGREIETVTLRLEVKKSTELTALARCSCHKFQKGTCAHLWALMIGIDQSSPVTVQQTIRTASLRPDLFEDDFEDDTEDDDFFDENEDPFFNDSSHSGLVQELSKMLGLSSGSKLATRSKGRYLPPPPPTWKDYFVPLKEMMVAREQVNKPPTWPENWQLLYVLDVETIKSTGIIAIDLYYQERKKNGDWGKAKQTHLKREHFLVHPNPQDRQLLLTLAGMNALGSNTLSVSGSLQAYLGRESYKPLQYYVGGPDLEGVFPQLCATNRFFIIQAQQGERKFIGPLAWDPHEKPWEFHLGLNRVTSKSSDFETQLLLKREEKQLSPSEVLLLLSDGYLLTRTQVSKFNHFGAFPLVAYLRGEVPLVIPEAELDTFLHEMTQLPSAPPLQLPASHQVQVNQMEPLPFLSIRRNQPSAILKGNLEFVYDQLRFKMDDTSGGHYDAQTKHFYRRNRIAEKQAAQILTQHPGVEEHTFRDTGKGKSTSFQFPPQELPRLVSKLTAQGWRVEAEGKLYRTPGQVSIQVKSGLDWFELQAEVDFEGQTASLPKLLAALRRGERFVQLGDGSFGMLPEEWLAKYGLLTGVGQAEGDTIKFRRSQAGLLDALLSTQPQIAVDEPFIKLRDQLHQFDKVAAQLPPPGFIGELRPYQQEGLGWLHFLDQFGFGGCLADDMGLGKTVQVLAFLQAAKEHKEATPGRPRPSLVVVPKSLLFNWTEEARRFTPQLQILTHVGTGRDQEFDSFQAFDIILTTYGTMLRDILKLKDIQFDFVILDESQAIKNASTETSKAARLLQGRRRLAMSGTPIENHLGEFWSLFEFLNPGILGTASVFQQLVDDPNLRQIESRELLAKAVRPFLLRRTKQQVAKDLPTKTEQTIYCEMEPEQRKHYLELRDYYRATLLGQIGTEGIQKNKLQILEGLLRLRQAACHPGLIDSKQASKSSAKLDVLLPYIAEIVDEGHKALIFSQFTSFLSIVRKQLDKEKIPYLYLDGKTQNRGELVEKFQTDPKSKLFLISLKAGGFGLNLTAAEYVFLLDPWWNPAVEAQAIDRTHRIGQTEQVFAYRLITRDTVEEKVLKLQENKRNLADAILGENSATLRDLGREDLELLLS